MMKVTNTLKVLRKVSGQDVMVFANRTKSIDANSLRFAFGSPLDHSLSVALPKIFKVGKAGLNRVYNSGKHMDITDWIANKCRAKAVQVIREGLNAKVSDPYVIDNELRDWQITIIRDDTKQYGSLQLIPIGAGFNPKRLTETMKGTTAVYIVDNFDLMMAYYKILPPANFLVKKSDDEYAVRSFISGSYKDINRFEDLNIIWQRIKSKRLYDSVLDSYRKGD